MEELEIASLERYAFADPAAGKDARNKKRRARQAIVVGARDWFDRWFFPHIWAGHLTASEFKDKIIETQEIYSPRLFGLEANGMQVLFGNLVREAAKLKLGAVKMIPVYQPTNVEKTFRIRTGLEPVILQGRFFLQKSQIEARSELQGHPTAATRDIIDAMETCIRIAPKRPLKHRKNHELEAYAKYLRQTQTPAHLIERKLAEFKKQGTSH